MYRTVSVSHATLLLVVLLLPFNSGGCSPQRSRDGTQTKTVARTAADNTGDFLGKPDDSEVRAARNEPEAEVSVILADRDTFVQTLKRHTGKVILVDFWATWCVPCVQQFPHTVRLSREHRDRGLAVISVSMDDPTDETKVKTFLSEQGADFDNLLGQYGVGNEFAEAFEIRGDVPFYKLYDRTGQLRYEFSADPSGLANGESITQIDQRVKELLNE